MRLRLYFTYLYYEPCPQENQRRGPRNPIVLGGCFESIMLQDKPCIVHKWTPEAALGRKGGDSGNWSAPPCNVLPMCVCVCVCEVVSISLLHQYLLLNSLYLYSGVVATLVYLKCNHSFWCISDGQMQRQTGTGLSPFCSVCQCARQQSLVAYGNIQEMVCF